MGRRPSPDPKPKCPKHPDSYVVFDGKYGKPGHKRQRYRCWINGKTGKNEPFHRFVEQLPRQTTIGGVCVMCERDLHEHQGPSGPRNYCFSARDVAQALIDVGKGMTYSAAASAARRRAGRFPSDGNGGDRYTRHGQLVADWVEVFAPVVFEPFRRWDWPEEGTVVLDHLGFKVHAWTPDGRPKAGPVGFNVFAAMAYDGGVGRLWRLEAFPTASAPEWERFLSSVGGEPERVLTDGHSGTISAAQKLWPSAIHYRSEWHFRKAILDYLTPAKLHGNTRIMRAVERAFINPYFWEHFTVVAYRHREKVPKLIDWIETYGPMIEQQLWNRPRPATRKINPITTGGLEVKLDPLKDWLTPRTHGFLNRERLNRLLMLMQLQINEQADLDSYIRSIRDWLTSRDGQPKPRRLIADPYGTSSLLSPNAQKFRKVPGASAG